MDALQQRRASDGAPRTTTDIIRGLVETAADPQTRAILMVLLELNQSIIDDATLTRQIADEFNQHKERFDQHVKNLDDHAEKTKTLIDKGIGSWRTLAIMGPTIVSVAVLLASALIGVYLNELRKASERQEVQAEQIGDLRREFAEMKTNEARNTLMLNRLWGFAPEQAPVTRDPRAAPR